jgi:3-methylcrotonyl-CoA carboxylase beta subunit
MDQLAAKGQSMSVAEQETFKAPTLAKYAAESSAYYSSARLWDDGVIDPCDTRRALALGISASFNKAWPEKTKGVFRM